MLQHAIKEWAVVCQALARGEQAVILRKGGIAEGCGEFKVEHKQFWLYPTYLHQERDGIKADAVPLLVEALAQRPPSGKVRLSHFAEVGAAYHVKELYDALKLAGMHIWSDATIESRFNYRRPGLHVLAVRVFQAREPTELSETDAYVGCKSWVELDQALSTKDAKPVLNDGAFRDVLGTLDLQLEPPAYA
jgi:hypothetical protein